MTITANNQKITTKVKNTWSKTRDYILIDKLPNIGEEFNAPGYEGASVNRITEVNSLVTPTTAGDPCDYFNFYQLEIKMYDVLEEYNRFFYEYVAIEK